MNLNTIKRFIKETPVLNAPIRFKHSREKKRNIKRLQQYGYTINDLIHDQLSGKVNYCCAYGTLLGIIRDNGMIKHDDDMDYFVVINDGHEWTVLLAGLLKIGFELDHFYTDPNGKLTEMVFRYQGIHIDFFGLVQSSENHYISYIFYQKKGKHYINGQCSTRVRYIPYFKSIESKEINGTIFAVPSNAEEILLSVYGESWITPIKNDNGEKSSDYQDYDDMYGRVFKISQLS